MVDEIRVLRLLRSARDGLDALQAEAGAAEPRRADPMWLPGVKYTLATTIEACIDVAQHICAAEGWGPPSTNGETMRLLAGHGVLEGGLGVRMRDAVGFRNVLVHEYVKVDDEIVLDQLQDLSDIAEFVRQVEGWLPER